MRYTLFLHYQEMTADDLGEKMLEEGKAAFHAYTAALDDAGVLVSAEVLQPSTDSTTLTLANGKRQVQDGPYADTKEQIGGTFVIDVPDLDAALAWAEKCPAAQWGTIEIRPSAVRFAEGNWVAVS
ncbi:MAG: YciI family protein [Longimicrobiales bacterium]